MSDWTTHRARVGALSRSRQPDDPELVQARVALREARLGDRITEALAEVPPFSEEQRTRLALLLLRATA